MVEVKTVFKTLKQKVNANSDVGKKTLTVVYYGGHGMQNEGLSHIVMPDGQHKLPLFNLENSLRALG